MKQTCSTLACTALVRGVLTVHGYGNNSHKAEPVSKPLGEVIRELLSVDLEAWLKDMGRGFGGWCLEKRCERPS
jgi:hypothetical protein